MVPAAGSPTTERAREATENRLRHDHPALAAGRRIRRRLSSADCGSRPKHPDAAGSICSTPCCRARACGWRTCRPPWCWWRCRSPTSSIWRSGLGRRVQFDKIRLRGLFGRKQARLGAYNIVLYWIFFVTMLALIDQRRAVVFRLLRRPRRGDAALVRNLGDNGVRRPSCAGAFPDRRRVAAASDFSPDPSHRAAAAARCSRTAEHCSRSNRRGWLPTPPNRLSIRYRRSTTARGIGRPPKIRPGRRGLQPGSRAALQSRAIRPSNPTLSSSPRPSPLPARPSSWRPTGWRSTSC